MSDSKKHSMSISPANIQWIDGQPLSSTYQDFYYSLADSVRESQYVFIEANQLKQGFEKLSHTNSQQSSFTIAETGFGAGLNFVAAATLWIQQRELQQNLKHKHLHFISYEIQPLSQQLLEQVLNKQLQDHPQLSIFANTLAQQYPPLTPGFHRIDFSQHNIHLTLGFGDAQQLLAKTEAKVDAWLLDGFSPTKNPDLWNGSITNQLARLSKHRARFSTYTAASAVQKELSAAGFMVRKRPGYGKKREMLLGEYNHKQNSEQKEADQNHLHHKDKPWFDLKGNTQTKQTEKSPKHCLIIGGGLAGTACAYSMAKRGWQVSLMEREDRIATAASGNPSGVLFTKLSAHNNAINRFNQFSYLYALDHLRQLTDDANHTANQLRWHKCGVLQIGFDEKERKRQNSAKQSGLWPDTIAYTVDAKLASNIAGIAFTDGGLYFPEAGWVDPVSLCRSRVSHNNIKVCVNTEAIELHALANEQWQIRTADQATSMTADTVIIANAKDALAFEQTQHLPLRSLRGQITYLPSTKESDELKTVVCYQGYIMPAIDQQHCIGASFHPNDDKTEIRSSDHQSNIAMLSAISPSFVDKLNQAPLETLKGRAQLRCQTPDYLPIVGPVPDKDFYLDAYQGLRTGMLKKPFPKARYHKNLLVSVGHGSRGLTTSALSAEIIASIACNEPLPVDKDVLDALHPGRFIIRDLKRRLT